MGIMYFFEKLLAKASKLLNDYYMNQEPADPFNVHDIASRYNYSLTSRVEL